MIVNNVSTLIGKNKSTVAEITRLADLKYNTVHDLYMDKTAGLKFDTLNKLCFALNCKPKYLFDYIPGN